MKATHMIAVEKDANSLRPNVNYRAFKFYGKTSRHGEDLHIVEIFHGSASFSLKLYQ